MKKEAHLLNEINALKQEIEKTGAAKIQGGVVKLAVLFAKLKATENLAAKN